MSTPASSLPNSARKPSNASNASNTSKNNLKASPTPKVESLSNSMNSLAASVVAVLGKPRSSVVYCSTCHAPFCLQCHCVVHQLPQAPPNVLQQLSAAATGAPLTFDLSPYVYPPGVVAAPPSVPVGDRAHNVYVLATSAVGIGQVLAPTEGRKDTTQEPSQVEPTTAVPPATKEKLKVNIQAPEDDEKDKGEVVASNAGCGCLLM